MVRGDKRRSHVSVDHANILFSFSFFLLSGVWLGVDLRMDTKMTSVEVRLKYVFEIS